MGRVKIEIDTVECLATANLFSGDDIYYISTLRCALPGAPEAAIENPIPYYHVTKTSDVARVNTGYRGQPWSDSDKVLFDGECDDEGYIAGTFYLIDQQGSDAEKREFQRLAAFKDSLTDQIIVSTTGILIAGGALIGLGVALGLSLGPLGIALAISVGGGVGLLSMPVIFKIMDFLGRGTKSLSLDDDYLGAIALRVPVRGATSSATSTAYIRFQLSDDTDDIAVTGLPGNKAMTFDGEEGQNYKFKLKVIRS